MRHRHLVPHISSAPRDCVTVLQSRSTISPYSRMCSWCPSILFPFAAVMRSLNRSRGMSSPTRTWLRGRPQEASPAFCNAVDVEWGWQLLPMAAGLSRAIDQARWSGDESPPDEFSDDRQATPYGVNGCVECLTRRQMRSLTHVGFCPSGPPQARPPYTDPWRCCGASRVRQLDRVFPCRGSGGFCALDPGDPQPLDYCVRTIGVAPFPSASRRRNPGSPDGPPAPTSCLWSRTGCTIVVGLLGVEDHPVRGTMVDLVDQVPRMRRTWSCCWEPYQRTGLPCSGIQCSACGWPIATGRSISPSYSKVYVDLGFFGALVERLVAPRLSRPLRHRPSSGPCSALTSPISIPGTAIRATCSWRWSSRRTGTPASGRTRRRPGPAARGTHRARPGDADTLRPRVVATTGCRRCRRPWRADRFTTAPRRSAPTVQRVWTRRSASVHTFGQRALARDLVWGWGRRSDPPVPSPSPHPPPPP